MGEVRELVEGLFPRVEWDPQGEDEWDQHCARAAEMRAHRHALAAEYGYSPMDLFCDEFGRRPRGR